MDAEEWRDCPSYPGYQASSLGRVRSVDRVTTRRSRNGHGYPYRVHGKLKAQKSHRRTGHLYVSLYDGVNTPVAHLVLDAFTGPRPPGAWGLHWDDIPAHNTPENLRWGTPKENSADAIRNGRNVLLWRTECRRGHELRAPNVRPDAKRKDIRGCLACSRAGMARWREQDHSGVTWTEAQVQAEADRCYAAIMAGLPTPRRVPRSRPRRTVCRRGHCLAAPNLRSVGGCLACARATTGASNARRIGETWTAATVTAESDRHYRLIMGDLDCEAA